MDSIRTEGFRSWRKHSWKQHRPKRPPPLIPRRLLTSGGNFAGLLAAFLVAVSPAHRAFATDCMYESLGAGLSLAVIYLYLVTLQEGSRRAAIGLGLALTVLFLHKYNYWL